MKLEHSRLHRHPERGTHERAAIHAVLDEALVLDLVHVNDGVPLAIPMAFVRLGDELYVHGAVGNRALAAAVRGPATVVVTLLDGLVLATSAFSHSMNYRSVVAFGSGSDVADPDRKRTVLAAMIEKLVTGRAADVRPPTEAELRATRVVAFSIEEASLKSRSGGPRPDTVASAYTPWVGVVPLELVRRTPHPGEGS